MISQLLLPPELCSTRDLLGIDGDCYYIPPYQRHFGWDNEDIERFFEGIVVGINDMTSPSTGLMPETFMGTIVCFIESALHESITPRAENEFPSRIFVLIDGQQRLTVCLTTAMVLHDILYRADLRSNGNADDCYEQFNDLKEAIQSQLYKMLVQTAYAGDKPYFPRMIRSINDCWSKKNDNCKYVSPISSLISAYYERVENCNKEKTKPELFNFKDYEKLLLANTIENYIKWLSEINEENYDHDKFSFGSLPEIDMVFEDERMQYNLFGRSGIIKLISNLQNRINSTTDKKESKQVEKELSKYASIARVLTFSAYFLKNVKFIRMSTMSEDYALSIFDSLNTTGDPLTAFETLVPEVVKACGGNEKYSVSSHNMIIDEISDYLMLTKKQQTTKTKNLIVNFALAENGCKITTSLPTQRMYMSKQFIKQSNDSNNKMSIGYDFINNLLHVARVNEAFISNNGDSTDKSISIFQRSLDGLDQLGANRIWTSDDQQNSQLAKEATFCIKFLASARHTIVIPLISRFYTEYLKSESPDNHVSLCKAIRSTAAHYALWRSSRTTTEGLDNNHRRIMSNSSSDPSLPSLNFARQPTILGTKDDLRAGIPNYTQLSNEYVRLLVSAKKRPIIDDDDESHGRKVDTFHLSKKKWIELSSDLQMYSTKKRALAKFILLLNAYSVHNSDSNSAGIFDRTLWDNSAHNTIEHIKPQNSPDVQGTKQKEMLNNIGNLTLLPRSINSYIQDAGWPRRKLIYTVLSARNKKTLDKHVKELNLSEVARDKLFADRRIIKDLYSGSYIPTLDAIAQLKVFNFDQIQSRNEEVLGSVWDLLIEWLGSTTYTKE